MAAWQEALYIVGSLINEYGLSYCCYQLAYYGDELLSYRQYLLWMYGK